jgi:YgiT-type zinc finger domain-containing protein
MAGKKEKNSPRLCPLCGGELRDGTTTVPFFIKGKVIVIKEVPAEICADCSEAYMKSSVVSRAESLLDKLDELDSEMSIIHFKAA